MESIEFFSDIKTPVTVAHVISVVFGMGAALVSDTLFTFYGKDKRLSATEIKTLRLLSNIVWIGLLAIAGSGIGLFLSDVPKYLQSAKFLAKMSILTVLILNGFILHRYVWRHVIRRGFLKYKSESGMRKVAFACGAISLISWVSVCILGILKSVPISYGTLLGAYAVVVAGGITVSLLVEHWTFERK